MEQKPSWLMHQKQGAVPPTLKPFCPPIVIAFPGDAAPATPTAPVCATCVTRSYTALQARQQTSDAQETNYDSVGMHDPQKFTPVGQV